MTMADPNDRTEGTTRHEGSAGGESDEPESTYSGAFGERNRNTPGRTPRELGLDPAEMRGHEIGGDPVENRTSDISMSGLAPGEERKNPPLTEGVDGSGEGGLSMSGGRAGGARGHGGTSDAGAGGPEGESRGGPGEYKSTSRFDLDHGTLDET
jgi:hypothetical protein